MTSCTQLSVSELSARIPFFFNLDGTFPVKGRLNKKTEESVLTCFVLESDGSCLKNSSMDTKRVVSCSSSTSESSGEVEGGRRRLVS